ncbi:MAG: bifunctional phosphopantothenoylcysteine decarboxylase/phosphopantothenate--cysteine ligase CoaBC [Vicinamibacteria bacterium]|nr:bifunctional phosphopantothenoylcysteine decarboxylase/phosphopantothenate--cysteine ligase CoaBC [Vicinamibacteria bacterium]
MASVVLGVTGCIAAYKACELLRELQRRSHEVRVVMTGHATRFVAPLTFATLSRRPVLTDLFANDVSQAPAHVIWGAEADLLLVAPATANALAKFAHGVADDALSTLYLATTAPIVVAPAMNVNMWRNPATADNVSRLRARGVTLVEPAEGDLACGWMGAGRLAKIATIAEAACAILARRSDLAGETVLVTAGPTQEAIDAVRYISNRSSGKMGYRLAEAARDRGARVVLVSGPTSLAAPAGVEVLQVRSAAEMARVTLEQAESAKIVVMAAAVCDHRPHSVAEGKLKRDQIPNELALEPTTDVLRSLTDLDGERFLVGFAAEIGDMISNAKRKLERKNLDLIVANDVGSAEGGFDSENNAAVLIDRQGGTREVTLTSKRELSERIWDRIIEMRRSRREGK